MIAMVRMVAPAGPVVPSVAPAQVNRHPALKNHDALSGVLSDCGGRALERAARAVVGGENAGLGCTTRRVRPPGEGKQDEENLVGVTRGFARRASLHPRLPIERPV